MENQTSPEARIVVIDDHLPTAELIAHSLRRKGFLVETYTSPLEALAAIEASPPCLILCDILMPQMDGYELYEQVQAHPHLREIPFIFITALADEECIRKGKALGVDDYLVKPVKMEELLATVQGKLRRREMVQEAHRQEVEELKRRILMLLSHEFRTPLTSIYTAASILCDPAIRLTEEELRQFLHFILQGGERLKQLVEDFLLLARLESGLLTNEREMLLEEVDVEVMVQRVLQDWQPKAQEKGLELQGFPPPTPPPLLYTAGVYLQDALERLIHNAVKFTPAGGGPIEVRWGEREGLVWIEVKDHGIGIPQEHLPHIFEKFYQVNREILEQPGMGIGLAIAQGLVELNEGRIEVESTPGQGSTFRILLPTSSPP